MNIVMMTNTYKPIVGGLEKSVEVFTNEYRKRGHNVLIVTPQAKGAPKEKGVVRLPAIQNFNGTDFSVELPIPNKLSKTLLEFKPDIVHSHHPFLIGDTAVRMASEFNIPIVFTNHTLYEENTHYVPGDSAAMKRFVIRLARGYANLCDYVIAPSQSVADLLKSRGVTTPIEVLPTGIDIEHFKEGRGEIFRQFYDVPKDAFLVGIIGRVAPEKNVPFLAKSVAQFMKQNPNAYFAVVGDGPSLNDIKAMFKRSKLDQRLITTGILRGKQLTHAYAALDVFAFASHSETQGLVLVEAMATGTPVVAVDAPGVREVVRDGENGRIIKRDNIKEFAEALQWIAVQPGHKRANLSQQAKATAESFSIPICVERALKLYDKVLKGERKLEREGDNSRWRRVFRLIKAQTDLMVVMTKATTSAIKHLPDEFVRGIKRKIPVKRKL